MESQYAVFCLDTSREKPEVVCLGTIVQSKLHERYDRWNSGKPFQFEEVILVDLLEDWINYPQLCGGLHSNYLVALWKAWKASNR